MEADRQSTAPPALCDVAVVGGGIVGLAVAREMTLRRPHAAVCVLEREHELGAHQTGHNSGVIHAGVYYRPGSLRARLCVEGARELYAYCERRDIAHERCGKVIVAVDSSEISRLDELERRGRANGVEDLCRLQGAAEIERIEPHARGRAGLHSPHTGIVDFRAVAEAFADDVRACGGTILTGYEVTGMHAGSRSLRLTHTCPSAGPSVSTGASGDADASGDAGASGPAGASVSAGVSNTSTNGAQGVIEAGQAIVCAGAWSDRLAVAAGAAADPRIVPFRGAYLRVAPARRGLVRALIYPVPDPGLPFLGVHLTRHIDGEVLIGPTALVAGARDAYALTTVRGRDLLDTLAWPGAWRMAARWWRTGVRELRHAASSAALAREAARYLPELRPEDVQPAELAGVRAQAVGRDGRLIDEFVFAHTERALHVRNAPSPAATASLAIARYVVDEAERTIGG